MTPTHVPTLGPAFPLPIPVHVVNQPSQSAPIILGILGILVAVAVAYLFGYRLNRHVAAETHRLVNASEASQASLTGILDRVDHVSADLRRNLRAAERDVRLRRLENLAGLVSVVEQRSYEVAKASGFQGSVRPPDGPLVSAEEYLQLRRSEFREAVASLKVGVAGLEELVPSAVQLSATSDANVSGAQSLAVHAANEIVSAIEQLSSDWQDRDLTPGD